MKALLFIAYTWILAIPAFSQSLSVHEWGTFTTLSGSSGEALSGLYVEEEQLPSFVYHHQGFSPDPSIQTNGYRPCKNVTVKMETPVLYFYSPVERDVQIHVDFPNGMISQWYPERIDGELDPSGDIDLAAEQTGFVKWHAKILDPGTTKKITNDGGTREWTTPRETDANLIENHTGEVEKFLFYRGLGNFQLPVKLKFSHGEGNTELSVTNSSSFDIPFIYIYDHTESNKVRIWGIGPLPAGVTNVFTAPTKYYSSWEENIDERADFVMALENAGLTDKEASAMLRTWTSGYFQTMGFKVFWIVPRELTDAILPLQIIPTPDSLERVLVGKSEIMTPALEEELVAEYNAGTFESNWKGHHYYLSYKQRVEQLLQQAKTGQASLHNGGIFPNPVVETLFIKTTGSSDLQIILRNVLGEVIRNGVLSISDGTARLDVTHIPAGVYFLSTFDNSHTQTFKILKN